MKRLTILLLLLPGLLAAQNLRRWSSTGSINTLHGDWFYNAHPAYSLADSLKLVDFRLLKDTASALRAAMGGGSGMSIGGTVTSGTTGSILFIGSSSALAQDNSNFFWDNSNKRIGLGTSSPSYRLHLLKAGTGQTADSRGGYFETTGATFNTTSGVLTNYAGYFAADATKSAGGFQFANIGIMGMATGGDVNFGIATGNSSYTGVGYFYQSANNTTKLQGGPGTDNIAFGPDNRIRLNVSSVIVPSGSFSVGSNSDDVIGALQVYGKETLYTADSSGSPANMLWRDPNTKELKLAAVPSGGVTSINSQTGPAVTISAGTAITTSTLSNDITIGFDKSNTDVPHILNKQFSPVGNTGTSETDLYTYTLPANKLNSNGQTMHFEMSGLFNDATSTVAIQFYFAGTSFANTGALTISSTGIWSARGYIVRTNTTTATAWVTITNQFTTDKSYTFLGDLTGLDFTSTNVFKVTGQAGGGGGSTNDITAKNWVVKFEPIP